MKKYKKLKSASFALILSLLLVGCGENASEVNELTERTSGTAEQAQITVNTEGEKETAAEEDTAAETTEEETAETEPEDLPPDESLFEYYDLLNEEFEKYGVTSPIPYDQNRIYYFSNKDTIIITKLLSHCYTSLSYNIVDKTKNAVRNFESLSDSTFCNDKLYYTIQGIGHLEDNLVYERNYDGTSIPNGDGYLEGFAYNGENELWDNLHSIESIFSQPDGTVFLKCTVGKTSKYDSYGDNVCFMSSPDAETLTVLPEIEVEVEHGFTETRDYDILACYNNKLFVTAKGLGFCCIDANNMTWEKLDLDLKDEIYYGNIILSSSYKSVGRYLLFKHTIYDMETQEVLVHSKNFPVSFAETYYGGKYNVAIKDNRWYFYRCASDGSYVDLKYYESYDLGDQSPSKCTPISDKYYIYKDNYGYFLRTYEKGADEEETVYLNTEIDELDKILREKSN